MFAGLEEKWVLDPEFQASLVTWRMIHRKNSQFCVFTVHTSNFELPLQHQWSKPLPYNLANAFNSIGYCLKHGYDFWRVHLPGQVNLDRALPWYKLPLISYLSKLQYDFIFYLDADAFVYRTDFTLPAAIPSFFLDPEKLIFAPVDHPDFSILNAGTLLFRSENTTLERLHGLIQEWWDFPQSEYAITASKQGMARCHNTEFPAEQGCLDGLFKSSSSARYIAVGTEGYTHIRPAFIHHTTSFHSNDHRDSEANYQAARSFVDLLYSMLFPDCLSESQL